MNERTRLSEFDGDLARDNLQGQWVMESRLASLQAGPPPVGKPWLWQWSTVHGRLLEARDAFADTLRARRSITFVNPSLPVRGTTHTLVAGIQLVMPGEIAWSHRHSMSALRFVIEGGGRIFTAVDGIEFPMEPYDLILTPTWSWHDHHNEADADGIWLDVLDVPLILTLNQQRFEQLPDESRTPRYGDSSPLRYSWSRVLQRLASARERPAAATRFEYVSSTGGSCLPTLSCFVERIAPGSSAPAQRGPASTISFVVSGSGSTAIDGEMIGWRRHDTFALPAWSTYEHCNTSEDDAILFSVSDEALLRSMGLRHPELRQPNDIEKIKPDLALARSTL